MPAKSHSNRKYHDPRMLVEHPHAESHGTQRTVTINLSESPLSWLHARGHLTNRQMLAGETLRGDYESAALGPHITMTWENIPRSRRKRGAPMALHRTERMMQSKHRFDSALIALGPDLSDIAWRVICVGESVPIAEREMSWPVRSGKLVLKIALDRLAAFYRIPS